MNNKTKPAGELINARIDDGFPGFARAAAAASTPVQAAELSDDEIHKGLYRDFKESSKNMRDAYFAGAKFGYASHIATPVQMAGDASLPVIAYLRATPSGMPVWAEDCVCEDAIWPMEDDHGNESPDVSMPLVKLTDAQAALAYHAALNETLNDTNLQLREDVAGYQAALAEKNAEIAALRQAAYLATDALRSAGSPYEIRKKAINALDAAMTKEKP